MRRIPPAASPEVPLPSHALTPGAALLAGPRAARPLTLPLPARRGHLPLVPCHSTVFGRDFKPDGGGNVLQCLPKSNGEPAAMPTIETIARPRRNRVSVPVPEEYGSYPFRVILVPLAPEEPIPPARRTRRSRRRTFVDALLACPKLDEGESLDVSRELIAGYLPR